VAAAATGAVLSTNDVNDNDAAAAETTKAEKAATTSTPLYYTGTYNFAHYH